MSIFSDQNNSLSVSIAWLPLPLFLVASDGWVFSLFPFLEKWGIPYSACVNWDRDFAL